MLQIFSLEVTLIRDQRLINFGAYDTKKDFRFARKHITFLKNRTATQDSLSLNEKYTFTYRRTNLHTHTNQQR